MTCRKSHRALLSLLGLLIVGCSQCQAPSEQQVSQGPNGSASHTVATAIEEPTEEATNAFAKAANAFGVDLYGKLVSGSDNVVFSPASLTVALTMAWAGAREETAAQMANVLHLPESADDTHRAAAALLREWNAPHPGGLELRVANGLFLDKSLKLKSEFSNTMLRYYHTGLERLDLRSQPELARARINEWAKTETQQRIIELIPEGGITMYSRLVLTNAVYFLGRWERRFEREATVEMPFYLTTGGRVRAPMMRQQGVFGYARFTGVQVLALGYEGGQMTMLVVLPDARDGLTVLERDLSIASVSRFTASLRKQEVKILLPRFRIDPRQSLQCERALMSLGMVLAFDDRLADFAGMVELERPPKRQRLLIDDVYHKAFLQVDEAGTEAAGASAVVLRSPSAVLVAPPIPEFRADHPFMFLVRDTNSGAILFMGRVEDPSRG